MIKFIVSIGLCCGFLMLSACMYKTLAQRACMTTCESRLAACSKVCRNNCSQCTAAAAQSTIRHSAHYEHEQYVKGALIALQLNSFRDPLQCRKTTCNCTGDYQICVQSCGGAIAKRLQHVTLCS